MLTLDPPRHPAPDPALDGLQSSSIDFAPGTLGRLRDGGDLLREGDFDALRDRVADDGYLFLRGALERNRVLDARRSIVSMLAEDGVMEPGVDPMLGRVRQDLAAKRKFSPHLAGRCGELKTLLYDPDGAMMGLFRGLLGEEARHFDFTWLRTVGPGEGTPAHCDSVFMNRGTPRLFTAWTPLGTIGTDLGGLCVLPGSHRHDGLRERYGDRDIDTFCEDRAGEKPLGAGWIGRDLNALRLDLVGEDGPPWLTAEFEPGDVLIFTIHTVHASLDNRTADRLRLSSDSRYQAASEPADERWVGASPVGHGPGAQRSLIC